ncbi:MAG: hypothetical protein ABI587_01415 [Gemmatimonadales bacterium]
MKLLRCTLLLTLLSPAALSGQVRYSASLDFMGGTKLATDHIFQDITVSQKVAPTVVLGASLPVSARERFGVELGLGFGGTRIRESGAPPTTIGPAFRTLSLTGGVEGPIFRQLRYRVGAGILKYLPDKEDFFRRGGPTLLLLTGGANYHFPLKTGLDLVARLRYDYQRFSSDEFAANGFSRTQDVHRFGGGLGIEFRLP